MLTTEFTNQRRIVFEIQGNMLVFLCQFIQQIRGIESPYLIHCVWNAPQFVEFTGNYTLLRELQLLVCFVSCVHKTPQLWVS